VNQLRSFENEVLGKYCAKCKTGRIKVIKYQCPTCEEQIEPDDPTEKIRCLTCESEQKKKPVLVQPKEVLVCKNGCSKPRRVSLSDTWVSISRAGTGPQTTYNFAAGEVEKFDPAPFMKEFELKKIEPIDFENNGDFIPLSTGEQAAVLNIDNPFGEGGSSRRKKKDDDDEEDEVEYRRSKKKKADDDDEDDDEKPRNKKKKDDDEDEEDDDEIFN
jgi:DNA-directed RNA polymerase subunit RPC12/RpoP